MQWHSWYGGQKGHPACITSNPHIFLFDSERSTGGPGLTWSNFQKNRLVKQKPQVATPGVWQIDQWPKPGKKHRSVNQKTWFQLCSSNNYSSPVVEVLSYENMSYGVSLVNSDQQSPADLLTWEWGGTVCGTDRPTAAPLLNLPRFRLRFQAEPPLHALSTTQTINYHHCHHL